LYQPLDTRYASMVYRRCGKSGLRLPGISLGLWHNFGGFDRIENARAILHRAFDLGITHFDLANNYGPPPGSAEENCGRILHQDFSHHRDELIISSKAGYGMWPGPYGEWGSRKYLIASVDQSLRRLGLDYVDIFYSHRPDPNTPLEETMSALDHIARSGKALYIRISNYSAQQSREAIQILRRLGTPFIIHQARYSMFDRWVEPELLSLLDGDGVGCIAFTPLAQGLLTDRYLNGIPEDSRAASASVFLKASDVNEARLSKIHALNNLANQRDQSLAQMALAWVLRHETVVSALFGASRAEQVEQNVAALNHLAFTHEELQSIDEILNVNGVCVEGTGK
jgi:L-glyceraldehyde 3-phosphate reductase